MVVQEESTLYLFRLDQWLGREDRERYPDFAEARYTEVPGAGVGGFFSVNFQLMGKFIFYVTEGDVGRIFLFKKKGFIYKRLIRN